jgi:anti-anti-sigma factor
MMELKLDGDDGDLVRVSASGRITQAELPSSGDLMTQLAGDDVYGRKLLLNLERADFLDSSGVGWLLVCHKRCREAGGLLVVHSVPPLIHKTLMVLRMNLVLNLAEDAEGAAQAAEKHDS